MHVSVDQKRVNWLITELLERWRSTPRRYPFNRPDAILPQSHIPEDIRSRPERLAMFFVNICVWMRGGLESLQAFTAFIRMCSEHSWILDPFALAQMDPADMQTLIKPYIGWDSKIASANLVEINNRIVGFWGGSALNIIKGVRSYEEALRRIRNKRTKRDTEAAGADGAGLPGFQAKMTSLLVYFFDWAGLLESRFMYPSPADFHNFRLALSTKALVVKDLRGKSIRAGERLSAPWRAAVVEYMRTHNADPIEVSDVLWLFSLLMCGNSPATMTRELNGYPNLLSSAGVTETWERDQWLDHRGRKGLEKTCFVCPFRDSCEYAIPAQPYYRRGMLILNKRRRYEAELANNIVPEPIFTEAPTNDQQYTLFWILTPLAANGTAGFSFYFTNSYGYHTA